MKNRNTMIPLFLITVTLTLICFTDFSPKAFGVTPAPDGGYPGGNTAEGTDALSSLASGIWNTALGLKALYATPPETSTRQRDSALNGNTTGIGNTAESVRLADLRWATLRHQPRSMMSNACQ